MRYLNSQLNQWSWWDAKITLNARYLLTPEPVELVGMLKSQLKYDILILPEPVELVGMLQILNALYLFLSLFCLSQPVGWWECTKITLCLNLTEPVELVGMLKSYVYPNQWRWVGMLKSLNARYLL
jgi:hypothetical protein